jgi:hypothetical protein
MRTLPSSRKLSGGDDQSLLASVAARAAAEDNLIGFDANAYQSPAAASAIDSSGRDGITLRGTSARRTAKLPATGGARG